MNKVLNAKHETHRHIWMKFVFIIALFIGYFLLVSFQYGIGKGFLITWVTWSFFVLCTPIADAGFLIDFPVRLILNLKMLLSEAFVWLFAILINLYTYFYNPAIYEKTKILSLFKHILNQPFPFWIIIIVSGIGTFLSVKFGDELFDVLKHKDRHYFRKHLFKWQFSLSISLFIIILIVYDYLLKQLGVKIPL